MRRFGPAIEHLETALSLDPTSSIAWEALAKACNNSAWEEANGPLPRSNLDRALELILRARELRPNDPMTLNTLGVVQYRKERFEDAIATLEASLKAGEGRSDAYDLFFLSMAHRRLGHAADANDCFVRAERWTKQRANLPDQQVSEIARFRAEASAVLKP